MSTYVLFDEARDRALFDTWCEDHEQFEREARVYFESWVEVNKAIGIEPAALFLVPETMLREAVNASLMIPYHIVNRELAKRFVAELDRRKSWQPRSSRPRQPKL